jgi:hypothetical protein
MSASDWSHHLIEMERYADKAGSYLRAAQSIGADGRIIALINAQSALLEAINAAREALSVVRQIESQQRREPVCLQSPVSSTSAQAPPTCPTQDSSGTCGTGNSGSFNNVVTTDADTPLVVCLGWEPPDLPT